VEEALQLATLEEAAGGRDPRPTLAETVLGRIIPLSSCLPEVRQVTVSLGEAAKLRQGQEIIRPPEDLPPGELVQILAAGQLLALARVRLRGTGTVLAPIRVFAVSPDSAAREQDAERTRVAGTAADERKYL
jgi:hypothetical protein